MNMPPLDLNLWHAIFAVAGYLLYQYLNQKGPTPPAPSPQPVPVPVPYPLPAPGPLPVPGNHPVVQSILSSLFALLQQVVHLPVPLSLPSFPTLPVQPSQPVPVGPVQPK